MTSFCVKNQCTAGAFVNEPSCEHYTPSYLGGGCFWRTWFDRCLSPIANHPESFAGCVLSPVITTQQSCSA